MARKLKVLVNAIPAANPVTGIGRYVLDLYSAIQDLAGDRLELRFFDGAAASARPPSGPANLARFSALGRLYWKLPLAASLPIRLALHHRRERAFRAAVADADIYHETAFFPFLAPRPVRVVQTIHDLSLQLHPQWHPAERVAYSRRYFAPRLATVSRLLCVSDFTRGELLRFDASLGDRVTVARLGVDARFSRAGPAEQRRVRQRYALPERFLLFVGSGDPRKNTALLARMSARGRVALPVVCAGWAGWDASRNTGIHAIGYVADADMPALYSSATAFVFPSLYEGFGLPVLEAMACGCPVVVPRAHSMPELVADAGIYFDPADDVEALERAVARACDENSREALVQAGLERARRFTWSDTARKTLAAFDALL